jgi:hypothetical protein
VDLGSRQGWSEIYTGGILEYFEDLNRPITQSGSQRRGLWLGTG